MIVCVVCVVLWKLETASRNQEATWEHLKVGDEDDLVQNTAVLSGKWYGVVDLEALCTRWASRGVN